jgi:N-acetylneuraminate epimerase
LRCLIFDYYLIEMQVKNRLFILNLVLLITVVDLHAQNLLVKKDLFDWGTLPPLPDSTGFAGSFAGVANDVLIVAGGSNFPNGGTPWNGGTKKWYDKIFVLEKPGAKWKEVGKLPFPLGYGVSVSTKNGLILIGGSNETGHVSNVFLLRYHDGKIEIDTLPSLPFPLANSCGVLINNKIFIAGGLMTPSSPLAENKFLCLDLKQKSSHWMQLQTWPGPSRFLAVAGVFKDRFFLFSGARLVNGKRIYLSDAYSFSEKDGWKKLANLPDAVVAAPSPAFTIAKDLFIFGGDTGKDVDSASILKEKHPGFSDQIFRYNIDKNAWSVAGEIYTNKRNDFIERPNNSICAPVTTSLVIWKNLIVLPGGEVRPGTRTPNVIIAKPVKR